MTTATLTLNEIGVTASEYATIDRVAASLVSDEPALLSSLDFGPFVAQGEGEGSQIIFGDQAEIPLLTVDERPYLDHRMALLARPGDLVVLRRPVQAFFDYLADVLGMENISAIAVSHHGGAPVTCICRTEEAHRKLLLRKVEAEGGATLLSYITTGNTWRLAQWLGDAARRTVHVAGPSPRVARRVNDKLWFADLARRVLGRDAVPPTLQAFGPAAAAGLVRRIARQGEQVIVKVPDSAGSNGNIRLESGGVAAASLSLLQRFLQRRLHATGWAGRYPLLVGVWDKEVVCSPSAQMWIPSIGVGPPRIDGIFEQSVRGIGAAFVGGERTELPIDMQSRLASEALRIASVLQRIGFFGRCSFDAVLVKGHDNALLPHWIECNGRWGGVAIPMTAALRLNNDVAPEGLVLLQAAVGVRDLSMADLCNRLGSLLFRSGSSEEGIVVAAPPSFEPDPKITLMAMAASQQRAKQLMENAIERLRF